jgi:hypothetical protein
MLCKIYTVIKKQIIEWACLIWADTVMRSSNTRMDVLGNNLINFGKVQLITALIVS